MSGLEEAIKPLIGVWKCDNSRTENFEEFLAEMGVNFMIRKLAKRGSPTLTIEKADSKLVIKTVTSFNTKVTTLPMDGAVIDEEYYGGGKAKSHLTMTDGKVAMVSVPEDPKLKKTVVTREIVNGELLQMLDVGDGKVICKRVFVKSPE